MYFRRNLRKFLIYDFFDSEDIDLGSPNLQAVEIFSHTTSHKNLVILAFIGAELAGGGGADSAPLPGRVILDPIPGRGLMDWLGTLGIFVFKVM